jgi:homoserine dehydrogenase
MSIESTDIVLDKQSCRVSSSLDALQALLEKQIQLICKSDYRNFEVLTEQAASIVDELAGTKALEQTKFKEQCERLAKLYENIVAAQKDHVGNQVRRIREGRKALGAYHNSG